MSTFDGIISRLNELKELDGLSQETVDKLLVPAQNNHFELEVDGEKYPAWRIISNKALGPGKGGIRFHPEVCEDEVKSLSFWMALKNSLAGLPYGGGKGGVKFNPKTSSPETIEKISRAYMRAFAPYLGQDKDIPAPDVYTNSQIMGYMLDEYEKVVGHHEPAMITGKPLELGGIALRSDSTAKGGFVVFEEVVAKYFAGRKDLTIAVQGFGNAGANFVKMASEAGFKVLGLSDSSAGVWSDDGLDVAKLYDFKANKGSLKDLSDLTQISNEELLEKEVDVLVLAALENQVTEANADNIKAKYIIELANGPVNYEADKILFAKGIQVVPDILANSGGVVVSYFEWAQNRTGNILDEEYLANLLLKKMKASTQAVIEKREQKEDKISWRTAAYSIAVDRILRAEKWRGNL